MGNIKIREMEYTDIEEIANITYEAFNNVYADILDKSDLKLFTKMKVIEKWKKNFNDRTTIVAEFNEKIIGFCWYKEDVGENIKCSEIIALYVDNKYRRRGIGRIFIEKVKEIVKLKKKDKLIIWCLEKNYNARMFYEKVGGTIIKNMQNKYIFVNKEYPEVGYEYKI